MWKQKHPDGPIVYGADDPTWQVLYEFLDGQLIGKTLEARLIGADEDAIKKRMNRHLGREGLKIKSITQLSRKVIDTEVAK